MKYALYTLVPLICITSTIAFSLTKYSKTDLQTFESSNTCSSCQLSGIDWGFTDISTSLHAHASLTGSDLSYNQFDTNTDADFSNSTDENVDFSYSSFGRVDFSGSDMIGAKFAHCQISNSNFNNTNLENANFDGMVTDNLGTAPTFIGADLTGATFNDATLVGINFGGAKGLNDSGATKICGGVDPDGTSQPAC